MNSVTPPASAPFAPTFSGHQTFVFRYPWLKKGVDALDKDPGVFRAPDAIVRLGVGKNMVDSIRHWGLAARVLEEKPGDGASRLKPLGVSDFGARLLRNDGWDAYLEDDASLWLLHYQLVTNRQKATTWYFAFNIYPHGEFTRDGLRDALKRYAAENGALRVASDASLDSDVSCFVRTYLAGRRGAASTPEETLDCPLASLGLITPASAPVTTAPNNAAATAQKKRPSGGQATYRFSVKPKPGLPASVFAFALADFWNRNHDTQSTLSLREIVHGPESPGRVFRLDEDATLSYLDGLAGLTQGALFFADTALVRQAQRRERINPYTLLENYYRVASA